MNIIYLNNWNIYRIGIYTIRMAFTSKNLYKQKQELNVHRTSSTRSLARHRCELIRTIRNVALVASLTAVRLLLLQANQVDLEGDTDRVAGVLVEECLIVGHLWKDRKQLVSEP